MLVSIDFGKCFVMRFSVRPGNDFKNPALIAGNNVLGVGLPRDAL